LKNPRSGPDEGIGCNSGGLSPEFIEIAHQFLGSTKRINHLMFLHEHLINYGGYQGETQPGALCLFRTPFPNRRPRLATAWPDKLYSGISGSQGRDLALSGKDIELKSLVGQSEFDRWVVATAPAIPRASGQNV
jgi:hypothetical protein